MSFALYRLEVAPAESQSEAEDHDEWFTSFRAAKRKRAQYIREDPHLEGHRYGEDFQITRIEFRDLPPKRLVLNIMNRRGYMENAKLMLEPYKAIPLPPQED